MHERINSQLKRCYVATAGILVSGLWQGRQLAFTLACITVLVAFVYYVAASGPKQHQ